MKSSKVLRSFILSLEDPILMLSGDIFSHKIDKKVDLIKLTANLEYYDNINSWFSSWHKYSFKSYPLQKEVIRYLLSFDLGEEIKNELLSSWLQ